MKLVIDIPEEEYIKICDEPCTELALAVRNGIPLPKEHGKIVDASEVVKTYAFEKKTNALSGDDDAFILAINHAPTIIEADE